MKKAFFLGLACLTSSLLQAEVFVDEDSGVKIALPKDVHLVNRSNETRRDYLAYIFERSIAPHPGFFVLEIENLGHPTSLEEYASEFFSTLLPEQGGEYFYTIESAKPVKKQGISFIQLQYTRLERVNPQSKVITTKYIFVSNDQYICSLSTSFSKAFISDVQQKILDQTIQGLSLLSD